MTELFDTHAHYDDARYAGDLPALMQQMRAAGVCGILTCGTDFASAEKAIALAEQYDGVYAAVGVYPHETHKAGAWNPDRLRALAAHPKVVAIGEIGLDYYYDDAPKETQLAWARAQIALANELSLPISFHDRDAHADTLALLTQLRPRGVVHCFSGSAEMAWQLWRIGLHIGIGGVVTFKNARVSVEVVRAMPLESMVLETDAPYMTPVPYRGQRNRSDYIRLVAEKIAEIKEIPADEVLRVTTQTARELFLKPRLRPGN